MTRIKTFYFIQIMMSILFLCKAQSFDIYNEKIQLKNYNYSLTNNYHHANYPKSVKIENSTNELLDPIIKLHSSDKLTVSFDILNSEESTYAYTFIHCNSEWQQSNIFQSEYLDGFTNNYINNYQYSFNTTTQYCHYEFSFPNENINFTKSGNYIVLIYDVEKNTPVASKRFLIYEDLINVSLDIKKATLAKDREIKQEIDFTLTKNNHLIIQDPYNELKVIIQKNDDWNDIIKNCTPNFINNNQIEYDYQEELSFLGGSEYRDFDIKSLRYFGKNIQTITQKNIQGVNIYHVELQTEKNYNKNEYIFKYDLNGKYVISTSENKNKNTESEYALVKFTLDKKRVNNKPIYIYGELTNWDTIPEAKMMYNEKNKSYYGFLYLKQGYYNYQYVSRDSKNKIYFIDSNHQETRNEYSVYVYHRPIWQDYDRLIGLGKNTSNALN